jgi:hypothetical protein
MVACVAYCPITRRKGLSEPLVPGLFISGGQTPGQHLSGKLSHRLRTALLTLPLEGIWGAAQNLLVRM